MHEPHVIAQALSRFGSDLEIAAALGVTGSAVSHWKRIGIPAARVWQLGQMARERGIAFDLDAFLDAAVKRSGRRGPAPKERTVCMPSSARAA